MTADSRPQAFAVLRVAGMLALVALFARRVEWAGIAGALTQPGAGGWLAFGALAYAVGQVGNGLAWRGLLRAVGVDVSFRGMILHDLSSVFWSTVLPGGVVGEVVKGVRITRTGARPGDVAGAILTARLVGGTMACGLALGLLPWASLSGAARTVGTVALVAVATAGGAGLLFLRCAPTILERGALAPSLLRGRALGRLPPLSALAVAAALTLGTHVGFAVVYCACFGAAGQTISLADGAAICALTSVAQLVPVTVGGFGVRELTIAGLGATIVPAPLADAAAVALGGAFTAVVALGGLVELTRLRGRPPLGPPPVPPAVTDPHGAS